MITISGMIPLWAFIQLWNHVGGTCGVSTNQALLNIQFILNS